MLLETAEASKLIESINRKINFESPFKADIGYPDYI